MATAAVTAIVKALEITTTTAETAVAAAPERRQGHRKAEALTATAMAAVGTVTVDSDYNDETGDDEVDNGSDGDKSDNFTAVAATQQRRQRQKRRKRQNGGDDGGGES